MGTAGLTAGFEETMARIYAQSGASKWNLEQDAFRDALLRAVARRFEDSGEAGDDTAAMQFMESLHSKDLALALACRAGNEAAWNEFDRQFRPVIEKIAHAITRDTQRACEIASSLYGDLYGSARADGARRSPLDHYHGRSPLAAWLRVVIAQREAQAWREQYRSRTFAEPESTNHVPSEAEPADPDRGRYLTMIAHALGKSLDHLVSRDRLHLSYYYVQELTLAETAALLGEHESTASRNLARIRAEIRGDVEKRLRQEFRLSDDQIGRCFEYVTGDWPFDLARSLAQAKE